MKEALTNNSRQLFVPFKSLVNDDGLYLQSTLFSDGIPVFLIKIYNDLRYETFHLGVKVYVTSLSRNRVSKLDTWSRLEEALRFLNIREVDQKLKVLQGQFDAMRATPIGQKVYSVEIIIRAFEYFCTSRTLHSKLRPDYALPSIRTLTRITSKVGKLDEVCMYVVLPLQMKAISNKSRVRQLTTDTAKAIYQTCHGIVDLCKDLLSTSHTYVCIGKFTSDFIEKEFSKLRQGLGGTYFITVQQILEKVNMKKTSLLLSLNADVNTLDTPSGHQCSSCHYNLAEDGIEIFHNLETLENSLAIDTKMGLVHIAGYVTHNDPDISEEELFDVTTFYYDKSGGYTEAT